MKKNPHNLRFLSKGNPFVKKTLFSFSIFVFSILIGFSQVVRFVYQSSHNDAKENATTTLNSNKKPHLLKKQITEDVSTTETSSNVAIDAFIVPTVSFSSSTVTVNSGGNATAESQLDYSFTLLNSGTDATGVSFVDVLDNNLTLIPSSVKVTPIAVDDSYSCIGNVGINVPTASGVLANDIDPKNLLLQATATNTAGTQGTVLMNPDGSFTFTPTVGFSGTTTFSYTFSNGLFAKTATVTITVSAPIWFVNIGAASNGTGTLASPFKDWSNFATANALTGSTDPAANQTIFVYSGTYSGTATLKSGQKVLGRGATVSLASFAGVTVPSFSNTLPTTSGTKPNLTSSGATITLNTNNTLRGFDMGNSTTDIVATSFGTLTTSELALTGNGAALNLSAGTLAMNLTNISSTNAASEAVSFFQISGTLTNSGTTTITNPTGPGIAIFGNSSVTSNFGNTTINGSSNTALLLTSTNYLNTTFGSLDIAPDANINAIQSSGNFGSITCTSGTISTNNASVPIGINGANASLKMALNMSLTSVFVNGSNNHGMAFLNTSGNFTVVGTGTAGSGGTIQNTVGYGIYANNASGIKLDRMIITNTGKSCFYANNLSGTCQINNSTLSIGATSLSIGSTQPTSYDRRNVHILNKDVALTFNVDGSTFNGQLTTSPTDNHGFAFETDAASGATTVTTLNIKNAVFNKFQNYPLYVFTQGTAVGVKTDVGFQNCTIDFSPGDNSGTYVGGAIRIGSWRSGATTFNILNNTSMRTNGGLPIDIFANNYEGTTAYTAPTRALEGKMNGNTLTGTSGHQIQVKGTNLGVVEINGNTFSNGMMTLQVAENTADAANETARLDATVTNNILTENVSQYGVDILSGNGSSSATWSNVIHCVKISGNKFGPVATPSANINTGGLGLIRFRTEGVTGANASRIWLEGINGVSETSTTTYWNNNSNLPNSPGSSPTYTRVRNSGFGVNEFKAGGTCLTPNNPAPAAIIAQNSVNEKLANIIKSENEIEEITEDSPLQPVEHLTPQPTTASEQNVSARVLAGETVTINGAGAGFLLPAGKSMTISFSATISSTPTICTIPNHASISGSNFTTINSTTTNTPIVVSTISGATISASSVCSGGAINLTATPTNSASINWYNASSGGSAVATGATTYNPTNITTPTSYYAACQIGSCESTRTLVGSITIKTLPDATITPLPNPICQNTTLNLSVPSGQTSYLWSGNGINSTTAAVTTATPTATGNQTYSVTVTGTNGCTNSNTTSTTVNALTFANTSETNTTNISGSSSITLLGTSCNVISTVIPTGASPISGSTTANSWYESTQPSIFVRRHIEITPTTNASTATGTVVLYFTQADFDDFNAVNTLKLPANSSDAVGKSNLLIEKRGGSSSDGSGSFNSYTGSISTINPDDANIIWNVTDNRWEISIPIVGFSGFFVKTQNATLPIELLSFSGKNIENGNLLTWTTATEDNNKGFQVERLNGNDWTILGFVKANNKPSNYDFLDNSPLNNSYYRLRQIDIDGKETFSNIILVKNNSTKSKLSIYPNPVTSVLNIASIELNADYQIFNLLGQMLLNGQSNVSTIDVSDLPRGSYILKVRDEQIKFIKQ